MKPIETMIRAGWVVPVQPSSQILENHSLLVSGSRIEAILPTDQTGGIMAEHVVDLPGHALIPGLVNTHTHAAMSLMRGVADDLSLMDWLEQHIWPIESEFVSEQFCADGSALAIAEMLRSGTTCFNDMYFFPEQTAQVAEAAGIRASIGMIMIDFPTAYAKHPAEYLSKGLSLHDHYVDHSLITTVFAPHAPYTVSDEPLNKIRITAAELEKRIQMHVHETALEVSEARQKYGHSPLYRLQDLGLLSPDFMAVHMTCVDEEEIRLAARNGIHVIHCPQSNQKLASGLCPVQALRAEGINVALGTDGAASNNDLDMIEEMRTAALLAKAVSEDARALAAHEALHMATLAGARALGLDDNTGSLIPGKSADITAIDLNRVETTPVYDPVSQIVYAAGREQVTNVWVAGERLLENRMLTTLDEQKILHNARHWAQQIANRK